MSRYWSHSNSPALVSAFSRHRQQLLFWGLLLFLLTGCSFSQAQAPAAEVRPVRSPYPTFTPTPYIAPVEESAAATVAEAAAPAAPTTEAAAPAATDTPVAAAPTPDVPTPAPTVVPPRLVIASPLVNVRAGPGVDYPILTTAERGQEFDIVGKNAAGDWWRFCCVEEQPGWVIDELVEVNGAVEDVAVSDAVAQAPPTATPAQAAPPPAAPPPAAEPTATEPPPAPAFSFELQNAEQFPENKLVRVFLYVFDNTQALAGYSVRVTKDGAELPVSATSSGGQPGLTWPIADSRQRFQNMKVEFPGVSAAGTWVVQLVDSGGNAVGPAATFTVASNDPNQELYVRYKKP
jgi:hypothetical protein